jgi:DNA-binding NarL/FixJ family response regulator
VLSNYGEPEIIARSVELGALGHLIKSQTSPASLAQTIGELIAGSAADLTGT